MARPAATTASSGARRTARRSCGSAKGTSWTGHPTRRGRWRRSSRRRSSCSIRWARASRCGSSAGPIAEYQIAFWFPDGKSLLVVGNEAGKPTRAYRQDIPGGEPTPMLRGRCRTLRRLRLTARPFSAIDREQQVAMVSGDRRCRTQPAPGLTAEDSAVSASSAGARMARAVRAHRNRQSRPGSTASTSRQAAGRC